MVQSPCFMFTSAFFFWASHLWGCIAPPGIADFGGAQGLQRPSKPDMEAECVEEASSNWSSRTTKRIWVSYSNSLN